jgi:hypothetical protein
MNNMFQPWAASLHVHLWNRIAATRSMRVKKIILVHCPFISIRRQVLAATANFDTVPSVVIVLLLLLLLFHRLLTSIN